eukprot:7652245-Pyramimonas_sp.AAC.1
MWHRLVWDAPTRPHLAVASFQQLCLWADAILPRVSKSRGSSRGPLTAAVLSLQRICREFHGPF